VVRQRETAGSGGEPARLIGRAEALDGVRRALDGGIRRRGRPTRFVTVLGEPGIGKTTVAGELCIEAEQRGWSVLSGRATEFEQDVPFQALVEAIDDEVARRKTSLPDDLRLVLGVVFPSLAPGLASPATADQAVPGLRRARLHGALRALLEHLATSRPAVVVLDDVHWADPALVDMIDYLVRRPPHAQVLIALAFRTRQAPPRLVSALAAAPSGLVEQVALGPLTSDQSHALLGSDTSPSRARELHEQSGGNPFYLLAMAKAATPGSGPAVDPWRASDEVPVAVLAALLAEMDSLSPTARLLAAGAAVVGDPFEPDLVAEVAAIEPVLAHRATDELVERDLVRPAGPGPRFGYRHPLVRHVAYTSAGTAWRRDAHDRAARLLGRSGGPVILQAHHLARSARPGDTAAVEVLTAAAQVTMAQAPATAAELLRTALHLLSARGGGGTETDPSERHELESQLAEALARAGRLREAHVVVDRLLTELPRSSPRRSAVAAVRAMVDRLLGRHAEARAGLLGELAQLPDDDLVGAAALKLELASGGPLAGHFAQGAAADGALAAAQRADDRPLEAAATAVAAFATYTTGAIDDALTRLDKATVLVDGLTDAELARRLDATVWLAWCEVFLERYERAVGHFERALWVGRLTGQNHLDTYALVGLASAQGFMGQMGAATIHAEDAVEAAELSASDELRTMACTIRCITATRVGDRRTAVRLGEQASAAAGPVRDWWSAVAGLALAQARLASGADPVRCRETTLTVGGGPGLTALDPGTRPTFYQLLVHAELARGDAAAASAWVDRMAAAAEELGPGLRGPAALGDLARAEVMLASGDAAGAAERAWAAIPEFQAIGARLEVGRAHLVAGLALAAAGRRRDALDELAEAQALFGEAHAGRLLNEAVRAQRRLGRRAAVAPPPSAPTASDGTGHLRSTGLTRREAEVAGLVAEGYSNRQIAAALVVSERTVEAHLRNIFTKFEVSSRTALVAALARDHDR
jgi:DNA-binding NarL/FixJ family response regulator/tetratricopeptide (TPR) repeat protein